MRIKIEYELTEEEQEIYFALSESNHLSIEQIWRKLSSKISHKKIELILKQLDAYFLIHIKFDKEFNESYRKLKPEELDLNKVEIIKDEKN